MNMQDLSDLTTGLTPFVIFAALCIALFVVLGLMVRDLTGRRLDWSHPLTVYQYTRRLARKGDARACLACADMLERGTGGAPRNAHAARTFRDQALEIYRRDARRGDGYAWLKMGEIHAHGHHLSAMPAAADRCFHSAFRCNLEAAKEGDVNGLAFAGYQLRHGLGCVADLRQAMDYLEAAAEQGHVASMKSLAEMYLMPVRGPKPDPVKAAQWFRAAAAMGDAEALERVGDGFASASGETVSREQAYFWYASAARKGRTAAQRKLERLEEGWTPKQVRDVQDRLQSWNPGAITA